MIADMAMQTEAARQLTYKAAAAVDAGVKGPELGTLAAMAKCFASDVAMKVATDAVQLFGAAGISNEYPINRYFRDAKVVQIIEGTNQIQRNIIANTLLGRESRTLICSGRRADISAMTRQLHHVQNRLLTGKKALITGGGTGLGKSIAKRYLELGADVVICGRRTEVLEATAAELREATGGVASFVSCDMRNADAVEAMFDEIWRERPLDILVNNAAANFIARTDKLSPRAIDAVLNIVLHGSFYCTVACGRRWIEAGRGGTVLSVATTPSFTGLAFTAPSAAAKAGIVAMTRSLAVEWGPKGIRLNAVAPGLFPTEGAWERLYPPGSQAGAAGDWRAAAPLRPAHRACESVRLSRGRRIRPTSPAI